MIVLFTDPDGDAGSATFQETVADAVAPLADDPSVDEIVTYADIGGLDKGIGQGGLKGQFRNELAQADGFVHVVRAFQDDTVPHPYTTVDPQRDVQTLDGEFLLSDLVMIENRLTKIADELRIKGKKATPGIAEEAVLLERLKAHLESERPLRDLDLLVIECEGWQRGDLPVNLIRAEVSSGARQAWKTLMPPDPAGVGVVTSVLVSRDGSTTAYTYEQTLSVLYLVEGLQ